MGSSQVFLQGRREGGGLSPSTALIRSSPQSRVVFLFRVSKTYRVSFPQRKDGGENIFLLLRGYSRWTDWAGGGVGECVRPGGGGWGGSGLQVPISVHRVSGVEGGDGDKLERGREGYLSLARSRAAAIEKIIEAGTERENEEGRGAEEGWRGNGVRRGAEEGAGAGRGRGRACVLW